MARSKGVNKRLRFEVFRRDGYACRYCGRSAKDGMVLEPDHVISVEEGGSDDISNLVTSCFDCNRGKGGKHKPMPLEKHTKRVAPADDLQGLPAVKRTNQALGAERKRKEAERELEKRRAAREKLKLFVGRSPAELEAAARELLARQKIEATPMAISVARIYLQALDGADALYSITVLDQKEPRLTSAMVSSWKVALEALTRLGVSADAPLGDGDDFGDMMRRQQKKASDEKKAEPPSVRLPKKNSLDAVLEG